MRLLFIHEVNWRKKVVFEIHDYPELLSIRGHEVVFIDYPEGDEPKGLRRLLDLRTTVRTDVVRAHDGSTVEVRTPGRVLPPPFDRLVASLTHVPAIWRALKNENFDAVVLYGVPTNGWQTVLMARRLGVPVLFRSIDISHALRVTPYSALIRWAESVVLAKATAVSTHNVALRDYVVAHGAEGQRVTLEYPGLDLERFRPGSRPTELAARYGIEPQHRVVTFMGTLYRFGGLSQFLETLAPKLVGRRDLRVLLLGGGEAGEELRQRAIDLGIDDQVIFAGMIDYEELASHLLLSDVAINPFDSGLVTNCALPGKVLQYLGCGLAAVCTPLDGLMGMLPEGDGIVYRQPGEPFVDAVLELVDDDDARRELAAAGRNAMERICRWESSIDRFEQAIERTIAFAAEDRSAR